MGKFKENDRVVINKYHEHINGTVKGVSPNYYVVTDEGNDILVSESEMRYDNLLDMPVDDCDYEKNFDVDGYFSEMATIAFTNKLNVAVNPERHTLNVPYFKVYDNGKVDVSKKVARLHFKDLGIEIHNQDKLGKKPWIPSNDDIKNIKNTLVQPDPTRDNLYTVWQVL